MSFRSKGGGNGEASGQNWWLTHSGGKLVESNSWRSVVAMSERLEVIFEEGGDDAGGRLDIMFGRGDGGVRGLWCDVGLGEDEDVFGVVIVQVVGGGGEAGGVGAGR